MLLLDCIHLARLLNISPTDVFQEYKRRTGAVLDAHTGFLMLSPAQFERLGNLQFVLHGRVLTMTPNAQAWPRAFNRHMVSASALSRLRRTILLSRRLYVSSTAVPILINTTSQGGRTDRVYLVIGDLGRHSGQGFDFVNGMVWSERFYSVYDSGNGGMWVGDGKYQDMKTN